MKKYIKIFLLLVMLVNIAIFPPSSYADVDFSQALQLYYKYDYANALNLFQRIISNMESSGDISSERYAAARYYRGMCLNQLGEPLKALNDFLFMDASGIQGFEAWRQVLHVYSKLNEKHRAIKFLKDKVKNEPRFDYFYALGQFCWEVGDSKGSIDAFEKARAMDKNYDPLTRYYLTNLYLETNNYLMSGYISKELETIAFDPMMKTYACGMVSMSMGLYESALVQVRELKKVNPDFPYLNIRLVEILEKCGIHDEADIILDEEFMKHTDDAYYWCKAAEVALGRRDAHMAQELIERLDPSMEETSFVIMMKAYVLVNDNRSDEASELLEKYRMKVIQKQDFYPILVALYMTEENRSAIAELIARFNENVGGDFPIDNALYWMLAFSDPMTAFDKLNEFAFIIGAVNPSEMASWILARHFISQRDFDNAIKWVDRSMQAEPSKPDYPYMGAIVFLRKGDKENALKYWSVVKANKSRGIEWKWVDDEMDVLLK